MQRQQDDELEVKCRSKIRLPRSNMNQEKETSSDSATIHLSGNLSQEEIQESMDNLKKKLEILKSMVGNDEGPSVKKKSMTFIDEHVLSVVFGLALLAILIVTVYAFQALYMAATKTP